MIPAATLANGILFHIVPSLVQGRLAPGVWTAGFLYLPFSSWAFVGALRDGVLRRAAAIAMVAGTLMMLSVVLAARLIGGAARIA